MVNIPGIKPKQHHTHKEDTTDCPNICKIKKSIKDLKDTNCRINIMNGLLHSNRKIRITALKRLLYLNYEINCFKSNKTNEMSLNIKEINEKSKTTNNIILETNKTNDESLNIKEINEKSKTTNNIILEANKTEDSLNIEVTDSNKFLQNESELNNILFYMLDDPCHFIREISLKNIKFVKEKQNFDLNFKKIDNVIVKIDNEMIQADKEIITILKTTFSINELFNKILTLSYDDNTNIRLISVKKLAEGSFFIKNFNSKIFLRFCSLFTDTNVNVRKKVSKYIRKIQITNKNDITNILYKQPPNISTSKDMKFYNINGAIIHGLEDENTEVRLNTIKALYNFTLDLDLTIKIFHLILDMLNDDIEEVRRVSSYILVLISKKYKLIFNFQDLKILQGCLNEKCCIIRGNVFRVISYLQYNEGCLGVMEFIIKGITEFGIEIINCKNIDKIGNESEMEDKVVSEAESEMENEIENERNGGRGCETNETNKSNRENYNLLFDCLKNFVKNNFDFIKENINNVFDYKNNIWREKCLEDRDYLGRLCLIYYLNLKSKTDVLWYMKNHFRYLEILKFKYEICCKKKENKNFCGKIDVKVYNLLVKRFIYTIKNIEYFYKMNKESEEELNEIQENKFIAEETNGEEEEEINEIQENTFIIEETNGVEETIGNKISKKYLKETSELVKICKNGFIKSVWKYLLSYINGDKYKIKLFFFRYKIYDLDCNFCILKDSDFFKKILVILQNKEKFKIEKIQFGVNVVDKLSFWENLPINFYVFCFYPEIIPSIKVRIGYDSLFIYLDVEPVVHVTLCVACEFVSVCLVVRFEDDFVLSDIKFIKIAYL